MPVLIVAVIFAVMSLVTLILYQSDKSKARKGQWRIPEKTLLLCSFFGGAIGGLAAMSLFRHKTKHWYFWAVNIIGLVWQVALLGFLAFTLL